MSNTINYVRKFNIEKPESLTLSYDGGKTRLHKYVYYSNDDTISTLEGSKTIVFEGWNVTIQTVDEHSVIYIDDTDREDQTMSVEQLTRLCKENDISYCLEDTEALIYDYAENVFAHNYLDDTCDEILALAPDSCGSTLVITGRADDLCIVRDPNEDEYAYDFLFVPVIGDKVYDITHGHFGVNIYDYMQMLYELQDTILLHSEYSFFSPNFVQSLSEAEVAFWNSIMSTLNRDDCKELLVEAAKAYKERTNK